MQFNHGTETEIEISYDDDGNCVVYTTKDVPAGSPLRMSYGDPTNPSALFGTFLLIETIMHSTRALRSIISSTLEFLVSQLNMGSLMKLLPPHFVRL